MLRWILINGGCSYVNQYSGLSVLDAMSSPLSHALANVMKRATVITAAMVYQAKPVTPLHVCGVALSVFGAVGYQHTEMCESGGRPAGGQIGDGTDRYELVPLTQTRRCSGSSDKRAGGGKGGGRGAEGETIAGDISNSSSSPTPPDSPPSFELDASPAPTMTYPYPTPPSCL